MKLGRAWGSGLAVGLAGLALFSACNRKKPVEINPIEPSVAFSRQRVPLGSAVEVTYTWKLEPGAKKLTQDHQAMVHVLDSYKKILFVPDHRPTPATTQWEPGQTYSYTRTVFVPLRSYVGPAEVRMGLYNPAGRGERVGLKGDDQGASEIKVGQIELLPQTENILLVEKEGWHSPDTNPAVAGQERTWTKKEAVVAFKNPKKDVILYLEADTNYKAFSEPPVLTLSVNGGASGLVVPIQDADVFLKKVRFSAAELGDGDWVDLKFAMNQSFVPKQLGLNADERELGLLVYHLYVGVADQLGTVPDVVSAGPLAAPLATPSAPPARTAAAKPATKPTK